MTTIFDYFRTDQTPFPTVPHPHVNTWGPVSTRTLIPTSDIAVDINISNEDKLTFSLPMVGKSFDIIYNYPQPIDISKLKTISLIDVNSVGSLTYNLHINDTANTLGSLFSNENNGTVTWKLSELPNTDLTNIIQIIIIIRMTSTEPASGTIGELTSQTCAHAGNIIDIIKCLLSDILGSVKKRTSRLKKGTFSKSKILF